MRKDIIICFDIGGTKILKAVVEISGEKFKFLEIEEEKNPQNTKKIRNLFLDYCKEMKNKHKTRKVAISTAGIVDQKKKIIFPATRWYRIDRFDFNFLEKRNFSVEIENDGRCFALGEYFFGQGKGKQSVLTLTMGTGIGGGFILEGKNFRGSHESAMEVSHINFIVGNKQNNWTNFCAGFGIEKIYRKLTGEKVPTKDIFTRYKGGKDKQAREIINQAAIFLGSGVSVLVNIFDPDLVIFGGSISSQKNFMNKAIKMAKRTVLNKKANYKFAISSLGNKANLLGAAMLYK